MIAIHPCLTAVKNSGEKVLAGSPAEEKSHGHDEPPAPHDPMSCPIAEKSTVAAPRSGRVPVRPMARRRPSTPRRYRRRPSRLASPRPTRAGPLSSLLAGLAVFVLLPALCGTDCREPQSNSVIPQPQLNPDDYCFLVSFCRGIRPLGALGRSLL